MNVFVGQKEERIKCKSKLNSKRESIKLKTNHTLVYLI